MSNKVIKIESLKETNLYKELLKRNNEDTKTFVTNILTLCEEACDRATQIPKFFSEYTLHDKTHFLRVSELMSYVLGSTVNELNDIEIGLLLLSAFYHDQGMFIDADEYKNLEQQDEFIVFRDNWILDHPNYKEIKKQLELSVISDKEKQRLIKILNEFDSAILTEFLRKSHGQRSYDFIMSKLSNDRALRVSGTNVSDILAKICLSHVKSVNWIVDNSELNYNDDVGIYSVNSIFLCLVLRLADILDFDSDRTPDVLFKSIHFTNDISISEWQKHINVSGWKISKNLIRYTMKFNHPAYEKTARDFINWIDEELINCHDLIKKFPEKFSEYQIQIAEKVDRSRIGSKNNSYIYHDLEFSLSRDEIVKLLMTDKLYGSKSLFIRELLQNSLDALRLRKAIYAMDGLSFNNGEINFRHYLDENNEEIIECSDNGIGMDEYTITKFLGKVGRSYYRSPEFERLKSKLKEKRVDFEPCSQFGIGFMSCFMIGDRIQIITRKDYGTGKEIGKPLIVEINGLGGLLVIKEGGKNQKVGTTLKVFNNNKPLYYDLHSDRILLTQVLKGYALATEFPIKGTCEIEGIKDEVDIPIDIDKKQTYLEKRSIKKIKTFEVNLSKLNNNLKGFLRQSFLLDERGLPTIENNEAKWDVHEEEEGMRPPKMALINKENNEIEEYSRYDMDMETSVCLDGILVCGYPGRSYHDRIELFGLGSRASMINTEHFLTLDIRGELKPELNPAREPLSRGALDTPSGWKNISRIINGYSSIIWEEVLKSSNEGLESKTFWELISVYNGNISEMDLGLLYEYLSFPVKGGDWIKLSDIDSFELDGKNLKIKDNKGSNMNTIFFPKEIIDFTEANNRKNYLTSLIDNFLISYVEINLNHHNIELQIQKPKPNTKASDYKIYSFMRTSITRPFGNFEKEVIATSQISGVLNLNHPLVELALESQYVNSKNDLQEFANSFLLSISDLIRELKRDKDPFSTKYKSRPLKYASALFKKVDWVRYSDDLKPPYKVYVDENTTVEINNETFNFWLS